VPVCTTDKGIRGITIHRRPTSDVSASASFSSSSSSSSATAAAALHPADPATALRSLASSFGPHLNLVYHRMARLAASVPLAKLRANDNAYAHRLYCDFRPHIPEGRMGWGQAGRLLLWAPPPGAVPQGEGARQAASQRDEPISLLQLAEAELALACSEVRGAVAVGRSVFVCLCVCVFVCVCLTLFVSCVVYVSCFSCYR